MKLYTSSIISLFGIALVISSCHKKPKSTCASQLHAYTSPSSNLTSSSGYACTHGVIDMSTAAFTPSGTFSNNLAIPNLAAYNTTDNSYYVLTSPCIPLVFPNPDTLFKISSTGVSTYFTSLDSNKYENLIYNPVLGKFYAFKMYDKIVSLTLSGSNFSSVTETKPLYPDYFDENETFTINKATGAIYYATRAWPYIFIEKFTPGSGSIVVDSTDSFRFVYGLQFNKNDNKLYCMARGMDKLNWYFVKIDPASGAITTSPLSFAPNIGLFSATIDPCSNRYIVSTEQLSGGSSTYKLLQLDMNGNVVQSNTTPTFYNGLTVN